MLLYCEKVSYLDFLNWLSWRLLVDQVFFIFVNSFKSIQLIIYIYMYVILFAHLFIA